MQFGLLTCMEPLCIRMILFLVQLLQHIRLRELMIEMERLLLSGMYFHTLLVKLPMEIMEMLHATIIIFMKMILH